MMRASRVAATVVVLGVVGAVVAGCAGGAGSAPTRVPVPGLVSTGELGVGCDELLDALPGWELDPTLSPGPGTPAEAASGVGGTGCVLSKGEVHLLIGVAHPDEASVSALQDFFRGNGLVAAGELGESAFFDPVTGDAEVFEDGRWITVVSDSFESPSDVAGVIAAIDGVVSAHG
jgi:hypothetical protein